MLHTLVRPDMRSSASAITLFINNIIGLGIGPLAIGLLSDGLAPVHGDKALPYAMSLMALITLWAFVHFWFAARSLTQDIADSQQTMSAE